MKPKALKKRLVLNKKTIADLGNKKMVDVHGGFETNTRCEGTSCGLVRICPWTCIDTCISCTPAICIPVTDGC
jgi:hypothetical protein